MPLQNRVAPDGSLHAVPERGLMLGNRGGRFHRDDKSLGKRRWATQHWICCELHYKGMHHEPMGRGYTSLFFLDEVTALAAGHRPCFFCRRAEAKAFLGEMRVNEFDRQLHGERAPSPSRKAWGSTPKGGGGVSANSKRQLAVNALTHPLGAFAPLPHAAREGDVLCDGAMFEHEESFFAKRGTNLLRWSFGGYTDAQKIMAAMPAKLLTPPTILAILGAGYKPRWHPSALQWDTT